MKHIYLVSNNLMSKTRVIYPKSTTFKEAREKTLLSKHGEEEAIKLANNKNLSDIEIVYSSNYFSALNTSKYIADANDLEIIIDERLGERLVGELGSNEYRFLKGMQEHDFNYKLKNGESILEVEDRMKDFLREILEEKEEEILIVTHNIAILSLILNWCDKDYNLDDRLILEYQDNIIVDGVFHEIDLLKLTFDNKKLINLERIL